MNIEKKIRNPRVAESVQFTLASVPHQRSERSATSSSAPVSDTEVESFCLAFTVAQKDETRLDYQTAILGVSIVVRYD